MSVKRPGNLRRPPSSLQETVNFQKRLGWMNSAGWKSNGSNIWCPHPVVWKLQLLYSEGGGGAKVKTLIPAGRLTAVEESQRLEVKGWSWLLWLVCCWKIHLKRSIQHVGDDVAPVLIGGGLMLPTCDHSKGLTLFKKKIKMHVIRYHLRLWSKTTSSAEQAKPERNLRLQHHATNEEVSQPRDSSDTYIEAGSPF